MAVGADHRAVHKVLHPRGLGGVGDELSLPNLPVISGLHEVLDGEDAISAFQSASHRSRIIQIALDYFGARLGQGPGGGLGRIAGQRPDGETRLLQELPRDGAALLPRGAGHQYRLRIHCMIPFVFLAAAGSDSVCLLIMIT